MTNQDNFEKWWTEHGNNATPYDIWLAGQQHQSRELLELRSAHDYWMQSSINQKRELKQIEAWYTTGEKLFSENTPPMFKLGEWWADRPWRTK